MRTRAQASRDDALRRVTTLNRSLAVAAVLGVGVLTDVVANTATAHVRTVTNGGTGYQTALLTAGGSGQHASTAHHRSATTSSTGTGGSSSSAASGQSLQSSPAPSAASSSASTASPAPAPAPAPVVVVSGGS